MPVQLVPWKGRSLTVVVINAAVPFCEPCLSSVVDVGVFASDLIDGFHNLDHGWGYGQCSKHYKVSQPRQQ